jgi:hypothetical protein
MFGLPFGIVIIPAAFAVLVYLRIRLVKGSPGEDAGKPVKPDTQSQPARDRIALSQPGKKAGRPRFRLWPLYPGLITSAAALFLIFISGLLTGRGTFLFPALYPARWVFVVLLFAEVALTLLGSAAIIIFWIAGKNVR